MLKWWFEVKLWKRILGALFLGIIVGTVWGEGVESIRWIGDVFVNMIKMLVVPLIFTTLVAGIYAMGDPKKLGSIGLKAVGLYLVTTAFAIVIGLTLGTILAPGVGVELAGVTPEPQMDQPSLKDRLLGIVPTNPVAALASGEVLPIIFFAVLFGIGIVVAGEKARKVGDMFEAVADVMLKITYIVMEVAPFGVFALIAYVSGTRGFGALWSAAGLAAALYLGCLLHMAIVHGGLIGLVLRLPVFSFFRGALDAQMVAYSTSSSSATLPVTISVARMNLGIGRPVTSSVLPLGATVNMDGTAIYVGIVSLFAAQVFGIPLDFGTYLTIALITTLISIGTAAVPSASIFLLAAVLGAIGIGDAETALIVGFVLPFDRILDMMRTVTNVTGDLAVATAVGKSEDEFDEEAFRAAPIE